jgi:hypothetical protein
MASLPRSGKRITKPRSYVAIGLARRVAAPRGKHAGISRLARSLTEASIRNVRAHAVEHANHPLMFACDRALAGSERARVAIARWLSGGEPKSR